jgi:hypothetical protein
MAEIEREEYLFGDLPDAMVKELLNHTLPVAESIHKRIQCLQDHREELRQKAQQAGIICCKTNLDVPREPSVVGIDGSYQVHRLTALDLCAAAAIAVEGTVKEAHRHWPEPHYRIWVDGVPHQGQPTNALRGLMVSMEIELAAVSPHDLVLLDGSFASLIIYINQGVSQLGEVASPLADALREHWESNQLFEKLLELLHRQRTVAVPKFTSHNELVNKAGIQLHKNLMNIDGKTLATLILDPGEYTKPLSLDHPSSSYHLPAPADNKKLNQAMHDLSVVYFRPYAWTAAVRLEIPSAVAHNKSRLAMVLEGIQRQLFSPAVREPYPLFLADQMVKSLGAGIKVAEQVIAQQIAGESIDEETTLLFLQSYRTESGRGDTL